MDEEEEEHYWGFVPYQFLYQIPFPLQSPLQNIRVTVRNRVCKSQTFLHRHGEEEEAIEITKH
jgi:hypothetical protein